MEDGVRQEIARVAFELYEKSGREEGKDLLHWLEAEKIVSATARAAAPKTKKSDMARWMNG